jgi:hypothetical protein
LSSRGDRDFVTERANSRCEYCRAPQIVTGVTFHLEHIIPKAHGGRNVRANYALACIHCNGRKSNHLTGFDPKTGREIPLFDPRRDEWERHFRFRRESLELLGLTPKGRATVARLQFNDPRQIEAREFWVQLEIYP